MKKTDIREIMAIIIIVFLIILTFLYQDLFRNKFHNVVTIVLASYFTSMEQK